MWSSPILSGSFQRDGQSLSTPYRKISGQSLSTDSSRVEITPSQSVVQIEPLILDASFIQRCATSQAGRLYIQTLKTDFQRSLRKSVFARWGSTPNPLNSPLPGLAARSETERSYCKKVPATICGQDFIETRYLD